MKDLWDALGEIGQFIAFIFLIGLLIGGCVIGWMDWLGPAINQAQYNNFQTSPQHVGAVVRAIQNDCDVQLPGETGATKIATERDIVDQANSINLDLPNTGLTSSDFTCIAQAKADVANSH